MVLFFVHIPFVVNRAFQRNASGVVATVSLFISFQIKSCTILCWLADDRNPHLEEKISNFEITNKRIFNVVERIFKPDRYRLPDKSIETLTFMNSHNYFKH